VLSFERIADGARIRRRIHGIEKQSREGEECAARGKEVVVVKARL
jgi:hypothetical protein